MFNALPTCCILEGCSPDKSFFTAYLILKWNTAVSLSAWKNWLTYLSCTNNPLYALMFTLTSLTNSILLWHSLLLLLFLFVKDSRFKTFIWCKQRIHVHGVASKQLDEQRSSFDSLWFLRLPAHSHFFNSNIICECQISFPMLIFLTWSFQYYFSL